MGRGHVWVMEVITGTNCRLLTPISDAFLYISRPREHYWAALNKENETFHVVRSQPSLPTVWVGWSPTEAITSFPSALCTVGNQTEEHFAWETGRHIASCLSLPSCNFPGQRLFPFGFRGIWFDCICVEWKLPRSQHQHPLWTQTHISWA